MSSSELKLIADVSLQAAKGDKPRRISVVAYGGGLMSPPGWPNIIVDLAGLESPSTLTVLSDHDNSLKAIIGSGSPVNDGRTLKLSGILADSEAANQVVALSKSGVALKASVGISPTKVERREKKGTVSINGRSIEVSPGTQIVRSGVLQEISIVAIPADTSSSVAIAASSKRKSSMEPDETTTTDVAEDIESNRQLLGAEHRRIGQIRELCGDRHDTICATAIEQGWAPEKVKLEVLRAGYSKGPASHISSARGASDLTPDILSCSLIARTNGESIAERCFPGDDRTLQGARRFRNASLSDVAKVLNQRNGTYRDGDSQDDILRCAYQPSLRAHAGFSTLGLSELLSNVISKTLKQFYAELPRTWALMAGQVFVRDFKQSKTVSFALTGSIEPLGPSGEIKHLSASEEAYAYQAQTYAGMLAITRQMIRNDDMSAFDTVPRQFATAANRAVSDSLWSLALANVGPHWSTANGNSLATGAGSALSVASLESATVLLRKAVDLSGNNIDLSPRNLVVPPALEFSAKSLLASVELMRAPDLAGDRQPTGSPVPSLNLTLGVEPRISNVKFTGNSSTAWYLVAATENLPLIIAFLDGRSEPTVEQTATDFNSLGTQFRCYLDWGVALGDRRGSIRSPGA